MLENFKMILELIKDMFQVTIILAGMTIALGLMAGISITIFKYIS